MRWYWRFFSYLLKSFPTTPVPLISNSLQAFKTLFTFDSHRQRNFYQQPFHMMKFDHLMVICRILSIRWLKWCDSVVHFRLNQMTMADLSTLCRHALKIDIEFVAKVQNIVDNFAANIPFKSQWYKNVCNYNINIIKRFRSVIGSMS